MADKVQKIREEVERLQSRAEYNFGISLTENARQFWLGESNVLTLIGKYIGTMQKEPVKIKKGGKYRCLSDMINRDTGNIAFIGDNIYFAPKDNTLVSEEYGLLCDTSEDASNFELVEEPKECMFTKDFYTDEDRKALCEGCEEECKYSKKGKPVGEDLEQAIDTYLATYFGSEKENQDWPFLKKMAIHFANWQKEHLMAKAVDATVHIDAGGYPCIPQIELYDYGKGASLAKEGDKYKVILIKEE